MARGASPKTAAVTPPLHPDAVKKTCFTAERMPSAMPSAATLLFSDNILAAVRASICHLLFSKNAATPPLCRNAVEEQPKASPSALHPTPASVLLQLHRLTDAFFQHALILSLIIVVVCPKQSINRLINQSINRFILSF